MTSGVIPQEVYVWQRVWTDEVITAVEQYSPKFNQSIFLASEISYQSSTNTWTSQTFQDPIQYAQQKPNHYGLAYRIQTNAAQSDWSANALQQVTEFIQQTIGSVVTVQIDYDCPSNKLADYTKLLTHLRQHFPNNNLEITCLPDWLNFPEFSELIQQTDRYIMQVHGVSGHGKGQALCDTIHTQQVALQCAQLGRPYLIALPTYRHAISYDKNGKIESVASEGSYQSSTYEIVSADAVLISDLIKQWQKQRPALMEGVIWYRLPVSNDRMNWTWDTFQKVRHGNLNELASLDLEIEYNKNGSYQLTLSNHSTQHVDWPNTIDLSWQGFCISHHLDTHYTMNQFTRSKSMTLVWNPTTPFPISPGTKIEIGSFRFNEPQTSITVTTP